MSSTASVIRLGTRGSKLARWQADWVAGHLRRAGEAVDVVVVSTQGDRNQNDAIVNIGAQGVFTKEIQRALLRGEIDLAVHSLKDLPTEDVEGLALAAVPLRASSRDAFLSHRAGTLEELSEGARIGTGSLRRKTQIVYRYADRFRLEEIRGNVETRLRRLDEGEYDALILAEAGLARLGHADRIRSFLEPPDFLPAVGQGALGLEIRANDLSLARRLEAAALRDRDSFAAALAERAFLKTLQGGCIAPIAALGSVIEADSRLRLHGRILSLDGKIRFEDVLESPLESDPVVLGQRLAAVLIDRGAATILDEIRHLRSEARQ